MQPVWLQDKMNSMHEPSVVEEFSRGSHRVIKKAAASHVRECSLIDLTVVSNRDSVRLNDLLPEDWRMVELHGNLAEKYTPPCYLPSESLVCVEANGCLRRRGAMLELLHEIGHAQSYAASDPETQQNMKIMRRLTNMCLPLRCLSSVLFNAYVEYIIRDERKAHAHGLRMLNALRHRGVDLEPEMSVADIRADVRDAIRSYTFDRGKPFLDLKGRRITPLAQSIFGRCREIIATMGVFFRR